MAATAAAMISTSGGLDLVHPYPAPAFAAVPGANAKAKEAACDSLNGKILKTAFEQSEKLSFRELGWGDAEVKVLSQELTTAKALKKLYINGNALTDEGAMALAASLREGAAPKLTLIDLSGSPGVSETAKKALSETRAGLSVSASAQPAVPKQDSDAPTYKVEVKKKGVMARAETDKVKALYTTAFEQAEKLYFSDLKLGDAEVEVLSQALYSAKGLKKLFLNGNSLTDEGAEAIATALREGAAPQLKILNLSQKGSLSETTKRCIKGSREGLKVSFAALKQASDAPVYKAADDGRLKPARVLERAENTLAGKGQLLVDGSDATCDELQKIIDVDRATLRLQTNKLNSKVGRTVFESVDPEKVKKVEATGKQVEVQLERLEKLQKSKGCPTTA